ncbi:MAG TPA: hypothetical protein VKZ59_16115 [Acidobacteriota bacterium]|nr:hypothetical protein [Acidobacteriota bacterium]
MTRTEPLTHGELSLIRFRFKLGPQDDLPHYPPSGKWSGLDDIEALALRKLRYRPQDLWEVLGDRRLKCLETLGLSSPGCKHNP